MSSAQRHWPPRASARYFGLAILLAMAAPTTAQLTTNSWLPPGGGLWTNEANWSLNPSIPNSSTDVAAFLADYTNTSPAQNFFVTQSVNLTLNGIIYDDTGAGNDAVMWLTAIGTNTLTFDGTNPFIESRSAFGGGAGIEFNTPIVLGPGGVTKIGSGVASLRTIIGSGDIVISNGTIEARGNSTNFNGQFIVNSGTFLDLRSGTANSLGTTNAGTILNGTGQLKFRDLSNITISEPVTINGVNVNGSVKSYASSNVTFNGPVTLNTNGVFAVEQWFGTIEPGRKQDWFFNSVVSDGGNNWGVHFLNGVGSGNNGTGSMSRTSEIVVGGVSTYGGYTHITANRAPDAFSPFTGTVRLTNGNDRLPIGTTVFLGGITNGVGNAAGNGRLVLNGYNQELAGLVALGTGTSNRVIGGQPGLSTLTLNIGTGITNRFTGTLGGPNINDNNLALISKGPGILEFSGANTYTGTTTVTNGTLRVNGTHTGGGAYTIQAGGILGGTGIIGAAVSSLVGSFIAPGNDGIGGTLTLGNLDLDGTLQIGLGNSLGDLLDVNGIFNLTNGVLQFVYSETLTNSAYIFAQYDTLAGNAFANIINMPDGYTIDYSYGGNQIALVIPEPSTLALLALGLTLIGRLLMRRQRRG